MKYVIEDLHKGRHDGNLSVIRLEIDYELMTLYDAMQAKERVQIIRSKERLKQLRLEWLDVTNNASSFKQLD